MISMQLLQSENFKMIYAIKIFQYCEGCSHLIKMRLLNSKFFSFYFVPKVLPYKLIAANYEVKKAFNNIVRICKKFFRFHIPTKISFFIAISVASYDSIRSVSNAEKSKKSFEKFHGIV